MNENSKRFALNKRVLILRLLSLAVLCFIFANSMTPLTESKSFSDGFWHAFLYFCAQFMDTSGMEQFSGIRYVAHFIEFAVLGSLWSASERVQGAMNRRKWLDLLSFAMLVSVLDETIQIFTPGRSARVDEIWLDVFGYGFGMGIAILSLDVIDRKKKRES